MKTLIVKRRVSHGTNRVISGIAENYEEREQLFYVMISNMYDKLQQERTEKGDNSLKDSVVRCRGGVMYERIEAVRRSVRY